MLDIVIVNWNSGSQLLDAVSSIADHHSGCVGSVIIVDNDSTDSSLIDVESAANTLPFRLQIVRNDRNMGFGSACNQGATLCSCEFILFLNPDTRLFAGSLTKPLEFMRRPGNDQVGITGIQLIDERDEIARSCSRFPTLSIFLAQALGLNRIPQFRLWSQAMGEWDHKETRKVDQVIGAYFLVRRSLFHALGGFDERFFVYFEEVDFARRARTAGSTSLYVAEAQAFHAGGGTSHRVKAHRMFYALRSRLLYGFKHFPRWKAWALVFVTLAVEPLTRTLFSAATGGENVINTWRGYGMLYRDLPQILERARLP